MLSFTVSEGANLVSSPDASSYLATQATQKLPNDFDKNKTIISGDSPHPPEISSQTFLEPNNWYKETEGIFTWTLPPDVSAVAAEISNNQENKPENNKDAIIDPPVAEIAINKLTVREGVQYLSVNFKNQAGWGTVTNRKLKIDTIPPEPFAINVRADTSENSFPILNFEAVDQTSGINYYEVTVADNEPIRIFPDEARLGYLLKELEDGTYFVKVVATDMAGNTSENNAAVFVSAGWVKPVEAVIKPTFWESLTPTNLFIIFLLLIVLIQVIYYWYENKLLREREEKLRHETRDIQDQMEKIFSALRDEIYDQISNITNRKRLSAKEKEAVEGLTQALEVSETLIEKEINDIKNLLR